MARWEPNARERLAEAALDLFLEQGYESTTVAEIAERAGLTKKTFFRHFADKREVLFLGQDNLSRLFTDAIAGAPDTASSVDAVTAALLAVATVFDADRRAWAARRHTVVTANNDLRERELLKLAGLTDDMTEALHARGIPDPEAVVAAELAGLAFRIAFARWVTPSNRKPFDDLARTALRELLAAAAELSPA
ncbi:TetR/AcrR family transcriptional regulator [Nocardia concava]|uniref:TetR/AcrR family transcriptional regulator n=1 Tax=Nocardia concava TaxID=257281 RepID=UPI0002EF0D91|nr:TetR/AcrR family transcriptional regulator [Nocardia concava]